MDTSGMDRLARAVGRATTRRDALRLALALLLGQGAAMAVREASAQCAPNCAGRDCGGDGCGGSCGTCPGQGACIETLGMCTAGPGDCGVVGRACGASAGRGCCQLLECVEGVCTSPVCAAAGEACGGGVACCEGGECILGTCQAVAPTCAPTGGDCVHDECCEAQDTCLLGAAGFACTPTPPIDPACARAGERPAETGSACCGRMHLERGRCVVNRWDRCKKGGRSWCEQGTRCRGGKASPRAYPVCVPD